MLVVHSWLVGPSQRGQGKLAVVERVVVDDTLAVDQPSGQS